ncbi:octanoyl-[GcvH]:protein N-octanoyltransferase [Bacillus mesophilus]|uniref:Octanoyl-[GcvH]:protein N-octanoyltransferase n=1 Tax=Bacillus mesophilus TaxID=1808955 RepID=A0A6M0Q9H7_9BACI|nr:biotin/lipoate A/B protein ligase family protein [Bacillus mesophilus]MBM7662408.1 octanoyl-[GcvH]:protein N-octanoyltransferase [Bacillus mesophilus]NEY72965.1 lipoate--protein ligase family protein [Bacillus mesophilus]
MSQLDSLLTQPYWRIIDHSTLGSLFEAKQSFAVDDTLCASVGSATSPPTLRSWVHQKTVVLGIQDTKLPNLMEAVAYLNSEGYHVIVRNSGGLAVVLDQEVLNLSLIFPDYEKGIDINRGYDTMVDLITNVLSDYDTSFEAGEIVGSYCPGSYDLSINGKKFAGISQRRLRGGIAVQIYLCVAESGSQRAEIIKQFYEIGKGTTETKINFPTIVPTTMASLSELLNHTLTIPTIMFSVLSTLKKLGGHLETSQLTQEELILYEENMKRMVDRNKKALES